MTGREVILCLLEDRNLFYANYEYGPFRVTFGRGVDLESCYEPAFVNNLMTLRNRVAQLGTGANDGSDCSFPDIRVDRNFAFAYMIESLVGAA